MEQFHFEQSPEKEPLPLEGRTEVISSPQDIEGQLDASQSHYEEALEKLRAGDRGDIEYLEEMQINLIAWKNVFDIRFGTLSNENAVVHNAVLVRLDEVSQALEDARK
ncbi:MAG: hypothetical protein A2937_01945 [Candidatus Yonathbacteria bacterium RIFCSPLOWO2_01_FULL_47_33b]|uniref:Uncharacterized protein n=1 Tax=Candidatus Yonathbacteria bacterium RIFCSPLOWO2_01_FULL_47_33b TaxID=1802727 RepID=A0A1G2SFK9_9BACT|nr:MAG: hypothetical protein A2937_01945 [Candidatus Yonathbacteria bacterium RIFCSPLOWO2_01_FULL_47_33b]